MADIIPAEDPLFAELLDTSLQAGFENANVIADVGQVRLMFLSPNWKQGVEQNNAVAADRYREFHPENHSQVILCFFYRGIRCSRQSGQAFLKVLEQPPHSLSDEEYDSLHEVMRNKGSKHFSQLSTRTEELNGKSVL